MNVDGYLSAHNLKVFEAADRRQRCRRSGGNRTCRKFENPANCARRRTRCPSLSAPMSATPASSCAIWRCRSTSAASSGATCASAASRTPSSSSSFSLPGLAANQRDLGRRLPVARVAIGEDALGKRALVVVQIDDAFLDAAPFVTSRYTVTGRCCPMRWARPSPGPRQPGSTRVGDDHVSAAVRLR